MQRLLRLLIATFYLVAVTPGLPHAEAGVYLTPGEALNRVFPGAERIRTVVLRLNPEQRKRIEKHARARVSFTRMDVHIGIFEGKPIGYAMVHDVKGKSRPITFMVLITPRGRVRQVEVLAYRESHGGEIRYPSFLRQFVGKSLLDPIRNRRDIRNISGATISCRAISDGVRTLLSLWEEFYGKEERHESDE